MTYTEICQDRPEKCQEISDKMSAIWPVLHDFPVWHTLCLWNRQKTIINFKTK